MQLEEDLTQREKKIIIEVCGEEKEMLEYKAALNQKHRFIST